MSVIYEPKGRAKEYSYLACNLFTGCVHGCRYCYVPETLHISANEFQSKVKPRRNILEQMRKEAPKFAGTNKRVLLCFTCDPYQPKDIEVGITRQAISILRDYNIPFQILTKGGTRAIHDFDLYGKHDAFATTLTFLNKYETIKWVGSDGRVFAIEPNSASPANRIMAIRIAKMRGITTWVSIEPVLNAKESLAVIERTHDFVDLYKIGKLNHYENDIDWRLFGIEAINLCEKYSVPYYIKNDLAQFLGGVKYTNTDTRIVTRDE